MQNRKVLRGMYPHDFNEAILCRHSHFESCEVVVGFSMETTSVLAFKIFMHTYCTVLLIIITST